MSRPYIEDYQKSVIEMFQINFANYFDSQSSSCTHIAMFALHKCWTKVKSRDYCGVEPHQMYNCIACKNFSLFKTVQVHLELRVSPCEDLLVCTVRREYATIINSKWHLRVTSGKDQGC